MFKLNNFNLNFFSFSLLAQKKTKQKKRLFFKVFFSCTENQISVAKIFPRFQDFLTQNKSYTGEKDFQKLRFGTSVLRMDKNSSDLQHERKIRYIHIQKLILDTLHLKAQHLN
ncbi:hypothetical protein IWQ47_004797 [Aquimarina sp. EL_43]|nr:hypothetical protein [Aquimarina sp. EL_35]MBG6153545.1 hypothetical protein [Aquimarina sp. EL_32]MBG6171701.1 hypothetical protein [Aquimarina sp. EL_43]